MVVKAPIHVQRSVDPYLAQSRAEVLARLDQVARERPTLAVQISKALAALERSDIWEDTDDPWSDAFLCRSSKDLNTLYLVGANTCSCPAGLRGKLCYHRLARRALLLIDEGRARLIAEEELREEIETPTPALSIPPTPPALPRRFRRDIKVIIRKPPPDYPTPAPGLGEVCQRAQAHNAEQLQRYREAVCGTLASP